MAGGSLVEIDSSGNPRFTKRVVFISYSRDLEDVARIASQAVRDLGELLPAADAVVPYTWQSDNDAAWPSGGTWQDHIPRPTDPNVVALLMFVGERTGVALPSVPSDVRIEAPFICGEVDEPDKLPISGLLYEFLAVVQANEGRPGPAWRPQLFVFIHGDEALVRQKDLRSYHRSFGFSRYYKEALGQMPEPAAGPAYFRQVHRVARFYDEVLAPRSMPITFFKAETGLAQLKAEIGHKLRSVVPGAASLSDRIELRQLEPYRESDADFFYGREHSAVHLFNTLATADLDGRGTAIALEGPSGSGKSSFLRAGIIGGLQGSLLHRTGFFLRGQVFSVRDLKGGIDPAVTLIGALATNALREMGDQEHCRTVLTGLGDDQHETLVRMLRDGLTAAAKERQPSGTGETVETRLVLGIDQFEEVLDVLEDPLASAEEKYLAQRMVQLLAVLAKERAVWLIVTLSESRYEIWTRVLGSMASLFTRELFFAINEEGAAEILNRTFLRAGLSLAPPLRNYIGNQIRDIADKGGPTLALLSVCMTRLLAEARRRALAVPKGMDVEEMAVAFSSVLELGPYQEVASIEKAIEAITDEAWLAFRTRPGGANAAVDRAALWRLLRRLVRLTDGIANLRGWPRDDLEAENGDLVDCLLRHRITVEDRNGLVRLAHESLLTSWERVAKWVKGANEQLKTIAEMETFAKKWGSADAATRLVYFDLFRDREADILDLWTNWHADLVDSVRDFCRAFLLSAIGRQPDLKSASGWPALLIACRLNDLEMVRECLLRGVNVNVSARDGVTALALAATESREAIVEMLLEGGAAVDVRVDSGWTPLMLAAARGQVRTMSLLLEHGADTSLMQDDGVTALVAAAATGQVAAIDKLVDGMSEKLPAMNGGMALLHASANGHADSVRALVGYGADLETPNRDDETPLWAAAGRGHVAVVRMLLERHANIEAKDKYDSTPLIGAAQNGLADIVGLLLDSGANKEAANKDGWTPLIVAAANGHENVVRLLLDNGADKEGVNKDGWTPLFIAAGNGWEDVLRLLLDSGADKEAASRFGWTPLTQASANGREAVVRLLIAGGANTEAANKDGWTPLMAAAANGHEDIVRLLVAGGANCEAANKDGWTPLMAAAANGHKSAVLLLLEIGANKESASRFGWTPLMAAAANGHEDIVRLLIAGGANCEAANKDGWTPLMAAAAKGHRSAALLLLEIGANKESASRFGWTPLMQAAANGHEDIVRLLIAGGANGEISNKDGWTPLMAAAVGGHSGVVRLLLEAGMEKEVRTQSGRTPLSQAAAKGHAATVHVLLEHHADVEATTRDGWTPLMEAADAGQEEAVRALLGAHADVDASTKDGLTALMASADRGHTTVVQALIGHGAQIERRNGVGSTALLLAAAKDREGAVLALAMAGADMTSKNSRGETPLSILQSKESPLLPQLAAGSSSQQAAGD